MLRNKNRSHNAPSEFKKILHIISKHLYQGIIAIVAGGGILVYAYFKPVMDLDNSINQSFNQVMAAVTTAKIATQQFNILCQNSPENLTTNPVWLRFALNARMAMAKDEINLINSYEPLGKLISPQTYCSLIQITKEIDHITGSHTICSQNPFISDLQAHKVLELVDNDRQKVNAHSEIYQQKRQQLYTQTICS